MCLIKSDEGAIELAAAIIKRAIQDYKIELRKLRNARRKYAEDDPKVLYQINAVEIEREWFRSDYFKKLCSYDGEELLDRAVSMKMKFERDD